MKLVASRAPKALRTTSLRGERPAAGCSAATSSWPGTGSWAVAHGRAHRRRCSGPAARALGSAHPVRIGRATEGRAPVTATAGRAPQATSKTSYGRSPTEVWASRHWVSTPTSSPKEKEAPALGANSDSSKCRASPRAKGSATDSGRYQKCGSDPSNSTDTRSSASARSASAASSAATPPPAIKTRIAISACNSLRCQRRILTRSEEGPVEENRESSENEPERGHENHVRA